MSGVSWSERHRTLLLHVTDRHRRDLDVGVDRVSGRVDVTEDESVEVRVRDVNFDQHLVLERKTVISKNRVCFYYIAQYLVRWTTQNALHFIP